MEHIRFVVRRASWVALLAILVGVLCGLGLEVASRAAARQEPLRIVATFSILGDLITNVGGNRVNVIALVGANADAHSYQPTPADVRAVAGAEIIFENGLDFERWLERIYRASGSSAPRIVATQRLTPLRDEQGDLDPHFWHDVSAAITVVQTIRDALMGIDPDSSAIYAANAAEYLSHLEQLDQWVAEQVASIPADKRKMVTSHDTFGHFGRRYGVAIIGFALPAPDAQPSAQRVARLVQEIRAARVPAVFVENVSEGRLMQQIAREAGVRLGPELYTDALGLSNTAGSSYVDLVTHNVRAIAVELSR